MKHDPIMTTRHAGLLCLVGTPGQLRARLHALGAAPYDASEARYLESRRHAPDLRISLVVREAVQPDLFGGVL